jgi:hypothetical protein
MTDDQVQISEVPTSWFPMPDELVKRCGIHCAAVYGAVWHYARMNNGICKVSDIYIVIKSGVPKTTIKKWLKLLVLTGYLTVEENMADLDKFQRATHIYRLTDKLVLDIPDDELGIGHGNL